MEEMEGVEEVDEMDLVDVHVPLAIYLHFNCQL